MDPGLRSPMIDCFRRGDVSADVRLLAARGQLVPSPVEQIALLVLLTGDADDEVKQVAEQTLSAVPEEPLRGLLARSDVTQEIRAFFAARGLAPASAPRLSDEPLVEVSSDLPDVQFEDAAGADAAPRLASTLSVLDRMKLAVKGTREQRAVLIRDSNRMVAVAVLSSPKLSESEVEAFTRMGNVSDEVLRLIGTNRAWLKNYGVALGLCRNPKTPPAISMTLMHRLTERDTKMLSIDRNVPEILRMNARKILTKSKFG